MTLYPTGLPTLVNNADIVRTGAPIANLLLLATVLLLAGLMALRTARILADEPS